MFELLIFDILLMGVIALYALVAVFAFMATASERQTARMRRLWPRMLSLLACLGWPLVVGAMVLWPGRDPQR